MLEFDFISYNYKDGISANARLISNPAIAIKFEEGMKTMTQRV
jgi:hypothetical protein